jgi:hypothetical protein
LFGGSKATFYFFDFFFDIPSNVKRSGEAYFFFKSKTFRKGKQSCPPVGQDLLIRPAQRTGRANVLHKNKGQQHKIT